MDFFGPELKENFPPYLEGLEWMGQIHGDDFVSLFTHEELKDKRDLFPKNQNLNKSYDLIFSGCSETTSAYLSDDRDTYDGSEVWGAIVAKNLGVDSLNLGLGAAGAYEISRALISQFRKNGNPKTLLCLYPDLGRLNIPSDSNFLVDNTSTKVGIRYSQISSQIPSSTYQPTYSKRPHLKEDIIPNLLPVWLNLQSILFLEQYCLSNNIKFFYSSWSSQASAILSLINNLSLDRYGHKSYPGYIDTDPDGWSLYKYDTPNCGVENHAQASVKSDKYFDIGSDGKHMGKHRHMHIADIFTKVLS